MDEMHTEAVAKIQDQIHEHFNSKTPFRIYHGSTNSTRILTYKRSEMVDISELNRVLLIDESTKEVIVEPNVPMDKLVKATLKYGLMPPVVTEFPGITVGGAIQGSAGETSSFKWGCFSQTVTWQEIILGNGEKVETSARHNVDLFYGTAGSCGSLGLVTAARIKLIPAKKYVALTHVPVGSFEEIIQVAERYTKEQCDFIEGIMFSKNQGSVIVGKLTNKISGKLQRFSRSFDKWYYLYAKDTATLGKKITNTVPLEDYLFRYDRGAFWAGLMAFDYLKIPFNRFTRFAMNPLMKTRKMYQALQASAVSQRFLCQDAVMPRKSAAEFLKFMDKELPSYPFAFFLNNPEPRSPLQCNGFGEGLLINFGFYGLRIDIYEKFVEANRLYEKKVSEMGGRKWFYSQLFYTEKEFWEIYDKHWYDVLRKKYHATTLPDIYQRTRIKERFPMSIWRALFKTVFRRQKLRIVD